MLWYYSVKFTLSPQVNDINFENMSNDDAVRVLREIVHKPGWGIYFLWLFEDK